MKPLLRLCDPDWIQTSDLLLRRQLLYSAELPDLTVLNRGGKDKGNEENFWREILIMMQHQNENCQGKDPAFLRLHSQCSLHTKQPMFFHWYSLLPSSLFYCNPASSQRWLLMFRNSSLYLHECRCCEEYKAVLLIYRYKNGAFPRLLSNYIAHSYQHRSFRRWHFCLWIRKNKVDLRIVLTLILIYCRKKPAPNNRYCQWAAAWFFLRKKIEWLMKLQGTRSGFPWFEYWWLGL